MTTAAQQKKPPEGGNNKVRLWRNERTVEVDVSSGDEGQGWAVSYSDLLMVLMSFFIIFFSYQEEKPHDLLQEISMGLTSAGGKLKDNANAGSGPGEGSGGAPGTGAGSGTGESPSAQPISVKDLGSALNDALTSGSIAVDLESTPTTIKISFKEDLYRKREWQLRDSSKQKLDRVLNMILPYKDKLVIDVVGHTDNHPVNPIPGDIVTNNFILSSLRASVALDHLMARGFDENYLRASGIASAGESGRTLSIKFSLKDAVKIIPAGSPASQNPSAPDEQYPSQSK